MRPPVTFLMGVRAGCAVALGLGLCSLAAQAVAPVDMPDPMRAPAAVQRAIAVRQGQGDPGAAGLGGAPGGTPGGPAGQGASPSGPSGATDGAGARQRGMGAQGTDRARVTAIVLSDAPGRDAALIDGRVAHVGDKVAGGVLQRIEARGVTLREAGGRQRFVPLFVRTAATTEAAASVPAPANAPPAPFVSPVSLPSGARAPGKDLP